MTTPSAREFELLIQIRELKEELITFLAVWADHYARNHGLDGFHPKHFDRLESLGVRMDNFKRADVKDDHEPAPTPPGAV